MNVGLALTVAAVAWLGTTTGVAALFASAVPLKDRDRTPAPAPARPAPAQATPVRPLPVGRVTTRSETTEDDVSRER